MDCTNISEPASTKIFNMNVYRSHWMAQKDSNQAATIGLCLAITSAECREMSKLDTMRILKL